MFGRPAVSDSPGGEVFRRWRGMEVAENSVLSQMNTLRRVHVVASVTDTVTPSQC